MSARERIVVLHALIYSYDDLIDLFAMSHPTWASELNKIGEYYQGFVKKKGLDDKLAEHNSQTVTTFGTRRSRNTGVACTSSSRADSPSCDKENQNPKVCIPK